MFSEFLECYDCALLFSTSTTDRHEYGHCFRGCCSAIFSRRLAHIRRSWPHSLVHRDLLHPAAADRKRVRPFLHADRSHHHSATSCRRDLEYPWRYGRRHGRQKRLPDGDIAVLGRVSLCADEPGPQLLDAADLRNTRRHWKQSMASRCDPDAGLPLSRTQRSRAVAAWHGWECGRSYRTVRDRRAARMV